MRTKSESTQLKWENILQDFKNSNLSGRAFCLQSGIDVGLFYKWRNKLKSKNEKHVEGKKSHFIPVKISNDENQNPDLVQKLPNAKWLAEFAVHFAKGVLCAQ